MAPRSAARATLRVIAQDVAPARTPDFYTYRVRPIDVVARDGDDVVMRWADGAELRAAGRWLWENRMGDAIDEQTREGTLDPADLPDPTVVGSVATSAGDLVVGWCTGDRSTFDGGWLHHVAVGAHRVAAAIPAPEPWSAAMIPGPPTLDGAAVRAGDPEALGRFLRTLCRHGFARLEDLPLGEDVVADVGDRIGALRDTNFGRTWPVQVDPRPTSTANTTRALPPHTDLPTRETPPGYQLLHCRENDGDGGRSTMTDGLAVVARLHDDEPEVLDALTTLRWIFFNRSRDHDHRWSGPIIEQHEDGGITVRAFHPVRAFPDMAPEDVARAYDALQRFARLARGDEFRLEFDLRPGDLLAFDNRRMLHGRTAIGAGGGRRVLHGAYIDHDEVRSRLRVLARHARSDPAPEGTP